MAVLITDSEITDELHKRNYYAVSAGPSAPPQDNQAPPSTPQKQLLNIDPKLLLLISFGLLLIMFE